VSRHEVRSRIPYSNLYRINQSINHAAGDTLLCHTFKETNRRRGHRLWL